MPLLALFARRATDAAARRGLWRRLRRACPDRDSSTISCAPTATPEHLQPANPQRETFFRCDRRGQRTVCDSRSSGRSAGETQLKPPKRIRRLYSCSSRRGDVWGQWRRCGGNAAESLAWSRPVTCDSVCVAPSTEGRPPLTVLQERTAKLRQTAPFRAPESNLRRLAQRIFCLESPGSCMVNAVCWLRATRQRRAGDGRTSCLRQADSVLLRVLCVPRRLALNPPREFP
jgi:hypothetical protein